jgi:hypothetical protein
VTANKAKILLLTWSMAGCSVDADNGFEYELSGGAQVSPDAAHNGVGDFDARSPIYAHEAAAYLVLDDSVVAPWCGGVLVAPDVVMTASACIEGRGTSRLAVGLLIPNAGPDLAVEQAVVLDADPRLAAVVLAAPVEDLEPASVATMDNNRCDIDSVSYLYVAGDDVSDRWVWTGCFEPDTAALVPDDGGPNCHGDSGAPAFSARGDLIGIVVGASGGSPCIDSVTLAVPTEGGAFEEALDLSSSANGTGP